MPGQAGSENVQVSPLEHPAVKAWSELWPGRSADDGAPKVLKDEKETSAYLRRVGPGGSNVIAKRCRRRISRGRAVLVRSQAARFGIDGACTT